MKTYKTVMLSGGTGYLASWIVYQLLEEGHTVHTTVRKLNDEKVSFIKTFASKLPGKLQLFEADLLKEGSFDAAMQGCDIVIHAASPFIRSGIKDSWEQLISPALDGTRNVLESVNRTESVKRVVLTSSVVAIYGDAIDLKKTANGIFTEEYWNETSNEDHQPYSYSKTLAEKEAWMMQAEQDRWTLACINPGFILGPPLSDRTEGTSVGTILSLIRGEMKSGAPELNLGIVDVRDVARAHIQAAFLDDIKGRHILMNKVLSFLELAEVIQKVSDEDLKLPGRKLPKFLIWLAGPSQGLSRKYVSRNVGFPLAFDNSKSIKELKIQYHPIEETVKDMVSMLKEKGHY